MNNGKYFSLMDLARVDLMSRAGVLSEFSQMGWYPVVVAETMRFKKSIEPFDKFHIETVILGWDEKAFILRQRFIRADFVMAEAVVRARFLKKTGGSVMPKEALKVVGVSLESPSLESWVNEWNQNQI
jgi:acyl-CoA thioesterase FadM